MVINKSTKIFIGLFFSILLSITVYVIVLFLGFRLFFMGQKVLERIESPDGRYVALILEIDTGALGSSFALEILKNDENLSPYTVGNTFRSYRDFSVHWIDGNTLYVGNGSTEIYMQKTSVKGVKIEYARMKP